MFKDKTFYHQHIRKAIIAFGTIFNNINIERKDSTGAVAQTISCLLYTSDAADE